MVEHKVLITTSGLGTRLGNLTDKTNKCLVRVNDKPSISYIIESYPKDTCFVISLGHYGDLVRQFLTIAYPTHDFKFIEIDKYEGEGSSLGYSILQCKNQLQCPFIYHASDTIITNNKLPELTTNWLAASYKEDASHYRTIILNDDKIEKINEKGEINFDLLYIGISGIKDYRLFFKILENLVNNTGGDLSDVHAISEMLTKKQFKCFEVPLKNWFDVGNVSELNRTKESFSNSIEVLDKADESIYFFDEFVIKFFSDDKINYNRVQRGKNLYPLVPKLINSTKNFYKYEKAPGCVFSKSVKPRSFQKLLNWACENLWIEADDNNIKNKCEMFYLKKTSSRISQYLNGTKDTEEVINGESVPSINELIKCLDKEWLTDGRPVQYHGDFILDNIIETRENFTLIDWRQDFAGDIFIGDIYYDLAKLNHNLTVNHNIVGKSLYSKDKNNCYILTNSILNDCKIILQKFCNDNDYEYDKVEVITAIIWLNMAPLHTYPFNDFLFTFGKYNLYRKIK